MTVRPSQEKPADSNTLKALEITNIRLDAANKTIELLNQRIADKDALIEAQRGLIATREDQLAKATKIDTNSQQIQTIDQVRVEACQSQLAKADAEIHRLRYPGLLSSIFDKRTAYGAIAGFTIGRLTANQTSGNPFQFTSQQQSFPLLFQKSAAERAREAFQIANSSSPK